MLKKMNEKKNNKGFSLVELIVVILIMAVLAVALAPQVMKWVNNAKIAQDRQNIDTIVSSAQLAAATTANSASYTISTTGGAWTDSSGDSSNFHKEMDNLLGDTWESKLAPKYSMTGYSTTITVSGSAVSYTTSLPTTLN